MDLRPAGDGGLPCNSAIVTILKGGFETRVGSAAQVFTKMVSIFHAQRKAAFAAIRRNSE